MPTDLPPFAPAAAYYAHVSHGYDLIAGTYDAVEAANAVGRRLRLRMQRAMFETFRSGMRVLEIGCGTGIEAIALASRGVEVVATDLSPEMVACVQAKAAAAGLHGIEARALAAHEVPRLAEEYGVGAFDGAYSHGGVLNMEARLADVARGLATLVRPRGHFVSTVVNQASLFELVFYPLVLRPRKAFRRLGRDIPIPITRHEAHRRYVVPTRFYSPAAFARAFAPAFALRRLEGLQILLPPWNLADYVDRLRPMARGVEAIEDRLARKAPFNSWGSLFLTDFERVEG